MTDRNFVFRNKRLVLDIRKFAEAGLILVRTHQKENDGLGKTHQLMLVFVDPNSDLTGKEKEMQITYQQGIDLGLDFFIDWAWTIDSEPNGQAGRVPPHTMFTCGNPKPSDDNTPLLDFGAHRPKMLRVALNMYSDMARLIPKWVPVRMREREKQAIAEAVKGLDSI
ncbi:MAG: hypothetical protein AAB660_02375 [Patescibacteria group bacterium]